MLAGVDWVEGCVDCGELDDVVDGVVCVLDGVDGKGCGVGCVVEGGVVVTAWTGFESIVVPELPK